MKLSRLVATCCLVAAPASLHAQAAATSDPITGSWTGEMGPDSTHRIRVNIALKFDGKVVSGVVTGPGITPGDINGGTFDSRTGAVNFLVVVRDGDTRVRFEGTVVRDTMSGKVSSDNITGTFKIAKGEPVMAPSATAARPRTAADTAMFAVRAGFTQVNDWVTRSMALVPADKYTYRPVGSVRTFGQQIGHIIDSYQYYCGRAAGRNAQWSDAVEKGATDRGTLTQKFRLAIDVCHSAYAAGQFGPLMENVAHTNLHYGNIVTYLRMMGLTPPSS